MDNNEIELYNTGYIRRKYVKPLTHCFCAAVIHECGQLETDDLLKGYKRLKGFLENSCKEHKDNGIRKISECEDLLIYFFNQSCKIPAYVYYWFQDTYFHIFGDVSEYPYKHTDVYNKLQRIYIDKCRYFKKLNSDSRRYEQLSRRKLCKMFRSGDFAATFKLYNKSLSDFIDTKELKDISDLFANLLPDLFDSLSTSAERCAVAYMIGRIQGREDNENAPESGGTLQQAITKVINNCTDTHKLMVIHTFVSNLISK